MDVCLMCKTRAMLKQAEKIIDEVPTINSPHYDDVIADLMNSISNACSTFSCYCETQTCQCGDDCVPMLGDNTCVRCDLPLLLELDSC